jgi:hypothetical protein
MTVKQAVMKKWKRIRVGCKFNRYAFIDRVRSMYPIGKGRPSEDSVRRIMDSMNWTFGENPFRFTLIKQPGLYRKDA